jgi:uncharacterized hydrophobic protein (TIGR00271 family)
VAEVPSDAGPATPGRDRRENGDEKERPIATAVEEAASEKLGVRRYDCPLIYKEAAEAGTDSDLPYWLILGLSGAIATLGLAIDSAAVVIGAMLVAPLLAPVMGLAIALVVGDAKLALQTGAVIIASTLLVIAIAALFTVALPFHTITLEISARVRPTTLDLAIAVCSGLVGAVVTVARGHRLSAAIPGVVVAVALIPPLAVAGFGIGAGEWHLIYGSMLLYGANLAGIVLSGMMVFMLIGMYRRDISGVAERWHTDRAATGLAAWVGRARWAPDPGGMGTPKIRAAMVVGFVLLMGVPLSETLSEIAREVRIAAAVDGAESRFDRPGESSILSREMDIGERTTTVYLRVAATDWIGDDLREDFEREASARAGEPVTLVLEQIALSAEEASARPERVADMEGPEMMASLQARLRQALGALPLPDDVRLVGGEAALGTAGAPRITVGYQARRPLPSEAEQILSRELARGLRVPRVEATFEHVPTRPLHEGAGAPDSAVAHGVADLLHRYPTLIVEIERGDDVSGALSDSARAALRDAGVERDRIREVSGAGSGIGLRLRPGADSP